MLFKRFFRSGFPHVVYNRFFLRYVCKWLSLVIYNCRPLFSQAVLARHIRILFCTYYTLLRPLCSLANSPLYLRSQMSFASFTKCVRSIYMFTLLLVTISVCYFRSLFARIVTLARKFRSLTSKTSFARYIRTIFWLTSFACCCRSLLPHVVFARPWRSLL